MICNMSCATKNAINRIRQIIQALTGYDSEAFNIRQDGRFEFLQHKR